MSNATSPRSSPVVPALTQLTAAVAGHFRSGVRAVAFWIAALLPLAVLALLATGLADRDPLELLGLLALAAVCAVVGHDHSPGR